MAQHCTPVARLKLRGSGTGPQTLTLTEAASCGHDTCAFHQGHTLLLAIHLLDWAI